MRASKAITSVALVVLAAGALLYAYLFDRRGASDADRAERVRRVFPRFDAHDVRSVVFERDGDRVVLERTGGSWTVTAPGVEPADPAAVDALLEDLNVAARLREVTVGPAETGLSAPRARGRVRVGPVEYVFALGAPAPVPEGAAYMSLEGEGVFVVDRLLAEDVLRSADAYRDRTLVAYGLSEIQEIDVDTADGGGPIALVRSGATLRLDGKLRASRAAVETLASALGEARADAFVPESDSAPPAAAGSLSLAVVPRMASRARVDLRFGGPCPGRDGDVLVVARAPTRRAACVGKAVADALRVGRAALVDAGLFYARADEIAELRLESMGGGPTLDLARRGRGWHERAPEDVDLDGADADEADALAGRLTALRAADVAALGGGDEFAASAKITVVRVDGAAETLQVGPRHGGRVRVRRDDDGAVLELPGGAWSDLDPRSLRLAGAPAFVSADAAGTVGTVGTVAR